MSSVLRGVVYAMTTRRPLDTSDRLNACKFSVNFQASTVIDIADGQYLLDYGEDCGMDYESHVMELAGSDKAKALRARLIEFCKEAGLRVLPGVCGI